MPDKKKKTNPIVNYFKDVKGEMKKVAWPTYKQVQNNTIIVIVSVVIVGLFIALLDFGFGKGFNYIVNRPATEQKDTNSKTSEDAKDDKNIVVDDAAINGDAVKVDPNAATDGGDKSADDKTQAGDSDGE